MTAKEHYDNHLGNFYAWMAGDFTEKQVEQREFFSAHNILPFSNKIAFDLGAGHGIQSIPLATLGYNVRAVDFNTQLLAQLNSNKQNNSVEVIKQDILSFLEVTSETPELIVCMGDTITHFPTIDTVNLLIKKSASLLLPRGKFIISFRDLTMELTANNRFIPVKSDDNRILTCFLEYFDKHVMVHDILHEKQNGKWIQKVSAYPKLKLNEGMARELFEQNNLIVTSSQIINRMIHLIGEKS